MKFLWLKIAATIATLIIGGCMSPNLGEDIGGDCIVDDHDGGGDVVRSDPLAASLPSVTVTTSADAYSELAGWLGKSNTITIVEAMKVERPDVTLNIPAGASVSYEAGETLATFKFEKPLPTVSASVLGFRVSPTLSQIILKPDGSGVASTGLGRHGFRWLTEDEDTGSSGAAEPSSLPELWVWSSDGCPPCRRFDIDYAEHKADCGFKVVKKTSQRPTWMPSSDPQFWWHISGDKPTQADVANTRHQDGYPGWKDFIAKFKHSREPKKQAQSMRAGGPAVARPFAQGQPDRSNVGSRSVAIWSINGDSTPSRGVLLSHLTNDGIHRGRHDRAMLESLTTEQLRWLHDRDHQGK